MNIYSAISKNIWKSWAIMFLFVVFATTIAYVIGKATGYGISYTLLVFPLAAFSSIGSYFLSDKIVLATSGAKQIQKDDSPELFRIVENLSIGDGVPMPKVYIMTDPSPNAFATGRSPQHASVAVTTGILEKLSKIELEGVIAHELSHVKNYDTRLMAVTAVLVGFIALLADVFLRNLFWGGMSRNNDEDNRGQVVFLIIGIILAIISPIIASLIQLAISRKREFLADASGALLTRYPEGLASALEKISKDQRPLHTASNATAHLFIVNPFKKGSVQNALSGLFSTHPPIEERIKILREM
ncbi:MAG TPA: M48 family metalloprotease [Candidatus Saccharimonadales bacterium]|nr:M48 family metalloprotease [Candidatus Saccharimonadales bacterium]